MRSTPYPYGYDPICPTCHSFPCQCAKQAVSQWVFDPTVLIRIAVAVERIAKALEDGAA